MHRHDEDERIHLLFGSTHAPAIRGPWAQLLGSLVDRLSRFRLPLPPVGDRVAAWRSRISTARARFDRPIPGSRALAGFAALTGLAAVGWVGNIGWNPDDGAAIHPSPKAIDQPASDQAALRDTPDAPRTPIDDERLDVRRTTLGRGGTLDAALARVGVDESLRDGIQRAARRHLDPRRLPARMGITAAYDRSGALQRVSFRTELERYLKVSLRGPGTELVPRSEVLRLPVERDVESAGGRIERSVAQAFSNTPQGQQLTDVFADIFQWDVDLLVEPRPGDRVRMVYEAIRVGEVPDDLPAFGESPTRSGDFMGVGQVLAASYDGALAKSTGFWVESTDGVGGYYDSEGRPLRKAFLKSPLNYRRISSGFSKARRHPVTHRVTAHLGVDFAASPGTPVVATADGTIMAVGWDGPLGQAVRIRHGGSLVTVYGHLRGYAEGIRKGVEVRQNQVIGYVGSTGRATGPHLHYTMLKQGRAIDPLRFRNPPSHSLAEDAAPALALARQRWLPVMERIDVDGYRMAAGTEAEDGVRTGS